MKPQGWAADERALRLPVLPVLGDVPVARVTERHLGDLYAKLAAQGLGGTSCNFAAVVLKAMLSDAEKRSMIQRNPSRHVRLPRIVRSREKVILDAEEAWLPRAGASSRRSIQLAYDWPTGGGGSGLADLGPAHDRELMGFDTSHFDVVKPIDR